MKRKNTKKNFRDYNDYHDRGMIKWGTAYAMGELVQVIGENRADAYKVNKRYGQLSPEAISEILSEALFTNKPIHVQLNQLDMMGRTEDTLNGYFEGRFDDDGMYLDERLIMWDEIRFIEIDTANKWSAVK